MRFHAKIERDPKQLFFYLRVPPQMQFRLEELSRQIAAHTKTEPQVVDHITLLYIPPEKEIIDRELVHMVVQAAKDTVVRTPAIDARFQGWAYFDNEDTTALVALIDAPRLPELHVQLVQAMKSLGVQIQPTHGFIPHTTVNYLSSGHRVEYLPRLTTEFKIYHCELSSYRIFPIIFGDSHGKMVS